MSMKWHHWLFLAIVLFAGYWLGERYAGKLKGIPGIGSFT
jgi:hypothetical protein